MEKIKHHLKDLFNKFLKLLNFLKKNINFKKVSFFITKLIIFVIVVFSIPLIAVLIIYPPEQKIELGNCGGWEDIVTSDKLIEKIDFKDFKNLLANILQIPLSLDRYDVYIITELENCIEPNTPASVAISFHKGDPERLETSLEKFSIEKSEFYVGGDNTYKMPDDGKAHFLYDANDIFAFGMSVGFCDGGLSDGPVNLHCEVYAKPNKLAWNTRYVIVIILWCLILASLITIIRFINKLKLSN